jgi:hypothetical protein
MGGVSTLGLGGGLTTRQLKISAECYKMLSRASKKKWTPVNTVVNFWFS